MFCFHCGHQLPKEAKFCPNCGISQPIQKNNQEEDKPFNNPIENDNGRETVDSNTGLNGVDSSTQSASHVGGQNPYQTPYPQQTIYSPISEVQGQQQTNHYFSNSYIPTSFELLQTFVGKNFHYFTRKWGIEQKVGDEQLGEVKKVSWNWAAFFLNVFWAGYRKMYGLVFLMVLFWLVIDLSIYFLGFGQWYYESPYANVVSLLTAIFMGLFGNYLYYLNAKKKIEKYRSQDSNYWIYQLKTKGSTSVVGAFLCLVYGVINVFIQPFFITEKVEFGHGESGGYLVDVDDTFSVDDEIYFTFYFPFGIGGAYTIVIEQVENDQSYIYDTWDDEVSAQWSGVITSMWVPEEPGEYIVKVYMGDRVIAKGTFYITFNGENHYF